MDNKETRDYHECMTYTTRKFAEGSKLHCYLKKKYRIGIFNSPFTQVYTVCNALRKIILEERKLLIRQVTKEANDMSSIVNYILPYKLNFK